VRSLEGQIIFLQKVFVIYEGKLKIQATRQETAETNVTD